MARASPSTDSDGLTFNPAYSAAGLRQLRSTMRMLAGLLAVNKPPSPSRSSATRLAQPQTHGAHPQTARSDGGPHHVDGGARAAHHPRRAAEGDRLHNARAQRAGKDRCASSPACRPSGTTTVTESIRTRDHGEIALEAFGAHVTATLDSVSISGGQSLQGVEPSIPGDISSAAFFLCAAALFPDSGLLHG